MFQKASTNGQADTFGVNRKSKLVSFGIGGGALLQSDLPSWVGILAWGQKYLGSGKGHFCNQIYQAGVVFWLGS